MIFYKKKWILTSSKDVVSSPNDGKAHVVVDGEDEGEGGHGEDGVGERVAVSEVGDAS